MKKFIKSLLAKRLEKYEITWQNKQDKLKLILGKQLCFLQKQANISNLKETDFSIFSQFGEDGIINYLTEKIPIENKFFIEFGIENYNEASTRFLMMNKNWGGLVMDGSEKNICYVKKREYFWRNDLTAISRFITKENINSIINKMLTELAVNPDIGLLSIDIDGVDYWVLKEINCIEPVIIVCEYNSVFGNKTPLTVPYDEKFIRGNYHYSNLYWGANLKSFEIMLNQRGYIYVGSNVQNNIAFFVKKGIVEKHIPDLIQNSDDNFEPTKVRESRDASGRLNYLRGGDRLKEIKDLELLNLQTNRLVKIKELLLL